MNPVSSSIETKTQYYINQVSELMQRSYEIDWNDACGDKELIEFAIRDGLSPAAFVDYWAEKYDLIKMPTFINKW